MRVAISNLTLLGGYDAEFTSRDPWANPTRFLLNEDERAKGRPEGTILDSEENSDGLVVDIGFIFDGATWNSYATDGSLDVGASPLAPLISLRGGGAPITVRDCLFVNGSSGAVIITCPLGVFKNNVVLNTSGSSLAFRADGPGLDHSEQHRSLCMRSKFPSGHWEIQCGRRAAPAHRPRRGGGGIQHFCVRRQLWRALMRSAAERLVDGNVFAANLFNHLTDAGYLWADGSNWERRAVADSAFASIKGNKLEYAKAACRSWICGCGARAPVHASLAHFRGRMEGDRRADRFVGNADRSGRTRGPRGGPARGRRPLVEGVFWRSSVASKTR